MLFITLMNGVFVLLTTLIMTALSQPINMQSGNFVSSYIMEMGNAFCDDVSWVTVSSAVSFVSPSVFISLPTTTEPFGASLTIRIRDKIVTEQAVSFDIRVYQPNDTDCSKEWFFPYHLPEPLLVSWIIAEDGAYNFTNEYIFIGQDTISHTSNDTSSYANFKDIYYPTGCSATLQQNMCRFPSSSDNPTGATLGTIAQLQTLVHDRFLLARALRVGVGYTKFTLTSHESTNMNYKVLEEEETLSYIAFRSSLALSCSGESTMLLESIVLKGVTAEPVGLVYMQPYDYPPSVFGIISSYNGRNPVGMASYRGTNVSSYFMVLEDQCADEEMVHPYGEDITTLIIGEVRQNFENSVNCFIKYHSPYSLSPTLRPTNAPSLSELTKTPSASPSPISSESLSPSSTPTRFPICEPSSVPAGIPTPSPTVDLTHSPSTKPTTVPTNSPSSLPTEFQLIEPSTMPTVVPTKLPTVHPTVHPTTTPTTHPTASPSDVPSHFPSPIPSVLSSVAPSSSPSVTPTSFPSVKDNPTVSPTHLIVFSFKPSSFPTSYQNVASSYSPTLIPTKLPSLWPSVPPSFSLSGFPSVAPTVAPTVSPTSPPTTAPSCFPSTCSTVSETSFAPTAVHSIHLSSMPSCIPTMLHTSLPSAAPTSQPTIVPTSQPTVFSSTLRPTDKPTLVPTNLPSLVPMESHQPSLSPFSHQSSMSSYFPSRAPTNPALSFPTVSPFTTYPTCFPTVVPSQLGDAIVPTMTPTNVPSAISNNVPTGEPTLSLAPSAATANLNEDQNSGYSSFPLIFLLPIIFGICCLCWIILTIFGFVKGMYGYLCKSYVGHVLGCEENDSISGSESGLLYGACVESDNESRMSTFSIELMNSVFEV